MVKLLRNYQKSGFTVFHDVYYRLKSPVSQAKTLLKVTKL